MPKNYKQTDPRWAGKSYAGETMAVAGCGPTAVADLLDKSPVEIADWLTSHGYASNGSGTYHSGITACLTAHGYEAEKITPNSQAGSLSNRYFEQFKESVESGNCGILLMGGTSTGCRNDYWCRAGHYIAIVDYRPGEYLVYDPAYDARDGWHRWNDFAGNIKHCFVSNVKSVSKKDGQIVVDGLWGIGTTKKAQAVFGTEQDGVVSNQNEQMREYLPNCMLASWNFVRPDKLANGSALIRAIQKMIGASEDGFFGHESIVLLQRFLGVPEDGYFGGESVSAFQRWLNRQ